MKWLFNIFLGGMSESREGVIEIQDCDYDLFEGIFQRKLFSHIDNRIFEIFVHKKSGFE